MSAQQVRAQRIKANCKRIWGATKDFEFDLDTDYEHYSCMVREDHGDSFGSHLAMTHECNGPDGAWNELDRMLALWAGQVESGRPMTKEQTLDIFAGPHGEHRNVINLFLNEKARRDAKAESDAKAAARKV